MYVSQKQSIVVMAGHVPAIHVSPSDRVAHHEYVDARIKSGHDELVSNHAQAE